MTPAPCGRWTPRPGTNAAGAWSSSAARRRAWTSEFLVGPLGVAPTVEEESRVMSVLDVFAECNKAVAEGVPIQRASRSDKEFHFQSWFVGRLAALQLNYDPPARNTYPDFRLVAVTIGFELKGLEFPGRIADFDCNSQVPAGLHNGRAIYYVFGRYPKSKENKYPVLDLVICHGRYSQILWMTV